MNPEITRTGLTEAPAVDFTGFYGASTSLSIPVS